MNHNVSDVTQIFKKHVDNCLPFDGPNLHEMSGILGTSAQHDDAHATLAHVLWDEFNVNSVTGKIPVRNTTSVVVLYSVLS